MTDVRRTRLLAHPLHAAPDRVQAYRVQLPPGQPAGPHFHPGPVTGYGESGLIAFEPDGQPARELRPGHVFVTIHENQFADWSFGNGVAQYAGHHQ